MKACETNLLSFIQEPNIQLVIPIYQRYYSWNKKECSQLLEDILENTCKEYKDTHFLGSIVYIHDNEYSINNAEDLHYYMIVDGQQRIITVSLLIIAIIKYLEKYPLKYNLDGSQLLNENIVNEYSEKDDYYRLKLLDLDFEVYKKILRNLVFTQEDKMNQIYLNFCYFYNYINENPDKITSIYNGLSKLMIVDVALEREYDNAQLIFESLNSTGIELNVGDLIRNFILIEVEEDQKSYIYNNYWSKIEDLLQDNIPKFIFYYLTLKLKVKIKIEDIYSCFKDFYKTQVLSRESFMSFLDDLYLSANYLNKILNNKSDNKVIEKQLLRLSKLNTNLITPFVIKLYYDLDMGKINEKEFVYILSALESYILRRKICNLPASAIVDIILNLLKNINEDDYINSFLVILTRQTDKKRFPNDIEFYNAFLTKDIYSLDVSGYILSSFEEFDVLFEIENKYLSIEHIMPQTIDTNWINYLGPDYENIHEKYLNVIGNLTLTGYNSEMKNKLYIDKKNHDKGFLRSQLNLNRYLHNIENWSKDEIIERSKFLSNKALNIWLYPTVEHNTDVLSLYDDWTNKVAKEFILFNRTFPVKDLTELFVLVNNTLFDLYRDKYINIAQKQSNYFYYKNDPKSLNLKNKNRLVEIGNSGILINKKNDSNLKRNQLRFMFNALDINYNELFIYLK